MNLSREAVMTAIILGLVGAGAIGVLLRWGVGLWLVGGFPWAVLLVNAVGSFLIGYLYSLRDTSLTGEHWTILAVGGLGALTTFSSFALDTVKFLTAGQWTLALANVIANNLVCLGLCWLGLRMASRTL